MPLDLDAYALTPDQLLGIPFALIGAVLMAFGAQYQHRGVREVDSARAAAAQAALLDDRTAPAAALGAGQLMRLPASASWVLGTVLLGVAILFQLVAITYAPLIVVQPLGAIALVITAVLNARSSGRAISRPTALAILLCVGGVAVFVTVAAFTAVQRLPTERDLTIILILLGSVLVVVAIAFALFRRRVRAVAYIVGAGILYGFVVTLAKVVIERLLAGDFEWLTLSCLVALVAAMALGAYFVQNAYASGPPELVVAGLTVIDPLVAIAIGAVVLGEAQRAEWSALTVFGLSGALAIVGVALLARHHPEVEKRRGTR